MVVVALTAVDQATDHHQAMDIHQVMGKVDLRMDMARMQGMEGTRMAVDQATATGKVKVKVKVKDQAMGKVKGTVVQATAMDKQLKEDTVDQIIIMEGIKIAMEGIVIWRWWRKTRRMIQKNERKKLLKLPEA